MGLNILQLSDIHLCGKNSPKAESLLLGNTFLKGAPDVILVTGDIFDHTAFSNERTSGHEEENVDIYKAIAFFDDLIDGINSYYEARIDRKSILFVPGNHEILREGNGFADHFENYRRFLTAFYNNKIPNWYLSDYTFVRTFSEQKVIIVGYCSPHYEDGPYSEETYDDYGMIDSKQLFNIRNELRKIEGREEYSLIAALHHQFTLNEERDKKYVDKSYLRNNEEFIRFLSDENFNIVLHGHKHVSSNKRINIELDISKPERIITVLGCGSLSDSDDCNWYNYITVFPKGYQFEIEYSSYVRKNAGYILEREPIKLPIVGKVIDSLLVKNLINDDPDLSKAYGELCSYDTATPRDEVFRLIDSTILSLPNINKEINEFRDSLYFLLATVHYRYVFKEKKQEFLKEKIRWFISGMKKKYFHGLSCYDEICEVSEVNQLFEVYRKITDKLNTKQKKIIVLAAMTALVTDFYITIKYKSEEFYDKVVSKKIDFAYSGSNLTNELRGNTVEFEVDDEKRSLEIGVTCDTAEAIKICSLIVKEFEIILHDFERDFSDYGFRIYYVLPKLRHNDKRTNEIDSRQFTAYIPKLLPLLAGWNIYSEPEVFAREVIQNSIDAINVRRERDVSCHEDGAINISIGRDERVGLFYFNIADNGSGMTKYILERYLTTLGLSYYNASDFRALGINYSPISQFGIGFLSCFMLGKHIEVKTKHYSSDFGYFLDIPNYDGCFFIEEDRSMSSVGTSIRIWENPDQKDTVYSFDPERIVSYIHKYIRNVSVDIVINGEIAIPKYFYEQQIKESTSLFSVRHFVPIIKDTATGIWTASSGYEMNQTTSFGFTFYKKDREIYSKSVVQVLLNNGILVPHIPSDVPHLSELGANYFCVTANLPPETVNLDVSRDNLKNFVDNINWTSVKESFSHLRLAKGNSNAPYYLLQKMYSSKEYRDYQLVFDFDEDSSELVICYKKRKFDGNARGILKFLHFINRDCFKDFEDFPFRIDEFKKDCGEHTTQILLDLFVVVNCCIHNFPEQHYNVDAHSKEYDSSILNALFSGNSSFLNNNISIAREMNQAILKYKEDGENYKNIVKSIFYARKKYYKDAMDSIRSDITNMFKDQRYSTVNHGNAASSESIKKIMCNSDEIHVKLVSLFKSYLRRAYTVSTTNSRISNVDVAAITCSAVYSLIAIASVVCSLDMLKTGIRLHITRKMIEPSYEWFTSAH